MIGITVGSSSGGSGGFRGRRATNTTQSDISRSGLSKAGGIDRDFVDNRIVGGDVSVAGAWPWIVQLSDKYGQYCTGVIVSSHFILTAQPCVLNTEPEEIFVVAGAFQINTPEDSRAIYSVSSIHCNPENMYKEDSICVIHVSEEIYFGNYVQPMCLPEPDQVFSEGSRCFLAGWGETMAGNEDSTKLHELDMPLFSDEHCKKYYQQKNIRSYSNHDHICAGYFDQRGACTGDAGGPLMCLHGGSPTVAGILSWSEGCRLDSVPAVFSDLKPQLDFVKGIMSDPCLDDPCTNGGSCVLTESGGYTCNCPVEFGGINCQSDLTNIDDCAAVPCKNEGSCIDSLGGFTCVCKDAFYGKTCEEEIGSCSGVKFTDGPRARYPWAAFLMMSTGRSETSSPFCSASIIDNKHLLTTASCVFNIKPSMVTVEWGIEDWGIYKSVISEILVHPMYSFYAQSSRTYDIAIIRIENELKYDNFVQPACFSDKELPTGAECKLSGVDKNGHLNEAKINTIIMQYCSNWNPEDGMQNCAHILI